LNVLINACKFKLLRDLNRKAVDRWTVEQAEAGELSARTINDYTAAACAFGNWCVESGRLVANPFARLQKLDAKADRRRQRRALSAEELQRLLQVARLRPLAEYGREVVKLPSEKHKGRRTWTREPLTYDTLKSAVDKARQHLAKRPEFIAELERRGRERALIYKTLVLTGLRKAELASLTINKLNMDGPMAYARIDAADEKAGRGADVPLRMDLADDLRQWLADRLVIARANARANGKPVPVKLRSDQSLFNVPTGLVRILDRDLAAAGIVKRDDRGRTVDVHAMRHTFGTHLSRGGVEPRTAQAAMRHSKLDLTMNVYTDPRLLVVSA
jgi:integrase